jgi:hypothetical protein
MVIPDSPKHNHEEDRGCPVEVLGIGVRSNGEEHEDKQRSLEREGAEMRNSRSQQARLREGVLGEGKVWSTTYAKLQNRPSLWPRLKREGGIGSPENRRDTMQPMHSM